MKENIPQCEQGIGQVQWPSLLAPYHITVVSTASSIFYNGPTCSYVKYFHIPDVLCFLDNRGNLKNKSSR